MTVYKKFVQKDVHMGRFEEDNEIVSEIASFLSEHRITCGSITLIGALKEAVIGAYDRNKKEYIKYSLNKNDMEILHCGGNISMRDGVPFAHVHIMLGMPDGTVQGGHLFSGKIFVAEYIINEFTDEYGNGVFERKTVDGKSLALWVEE